MSHLTIEENNVNHGHDWFVVSPDEEPVRLPKLLQHIARVCWAHRDTLRRQILEDPDQEGPYRYVFSEVELDSFHRWVPSCTITFGYTFIFPDGEGGKIELELKTTDRKYGFTWVADDQPFDIFPL